ncbi:MAG: hypothetical protein OXF79_14545 [Chloroflexi bacterium]|nr:hypothetical protein [Chloroflexota bacterium]
MAASDHDNNLYDVILMYSSVGYAAICPGISGAVSQGADREGALAMIADAMALCLMHPLPGEENPALLEELRGLGVARVAELVRECQQDGLKFEVCQVVPRFLQSRI